MSKPSAQETRPVYQRLYEEVLKPMFPDLFFPPWTSPASGLTSIRRKMDGDIESPLTEPFLPETYLEDAFWLAEKVGLFESYYLEQHVGKWVVAMHHYSHLDYEIVGEGPTPASAICSAILHLYSENK